MSVRHVRKELSKRLPIYTIIRACMEGPAAIKAGTTTYLPMPCPEDKSKENLARYDSYLVRARFLEVVARTVSGFVGQVFFRDPVVELPPLIKAIELSADGGEMTLVQQSKEAVRENLSIGHGGLLTDYPVTGSTATRADQLSGKVRPTIIQYKAEQIINWRWVVMGARRLLSLLVLEEQYDIEDDGYEILQGTQWRVFKLEQGRLRAQVWRQNKDETWGMVSDTWPVRGNKVPWDRIPFSPYGCENNDPSPDKPPMEGLAHINIGHYRNSADYEESVHMVGQPTPWGSGLTEDWVKEVWKGEFFLGSRAFIPLPTGGACGLLQADPNTLAFEAMEQKERQMVQLGAKLVEQAQVQRTATESSIDNVSDNSVLSDVAKNVSAAYTQALKFAAEYAGDDPEKVVFELNTDFEITKLSPEERNQLISEWQGGGITWEEYRWNIKRAGVAFEDDKVAKTKIEEDRKNSIDLDEPHDEEDQ